MCRLRFNQLQLCIAQCNIWICLTFCIESFFSQPLLCATHFIDQIDSGIVFFILQETYCEHMCVVYVQRHFYYCAILSLIKRQKKIKNKNRIDEFRFHSMHQGESFNSVKSTLCIFCTAIDKVNIPCRLHDVASSLLHIRKMPKC